MPYASEWCVSGVTRFGWTKNLMSFALGFSKSSGVIESRLDTNPVCSSNTRRLAYSEYDSESAPHLGPLPFSSLLPLLVWLFSWLLVDSLLLTPVVMVFSVSLITLPVVALIIIVSTVSVTIGPTHTCAVATPYPGTDTVRVAMPPRSNPVISDCWRACDVPVGSVGLVVAPVYPANSVPVARPP